MTWLQRELQLPPFSAGCHLITREILDALPELDRVKVGLLHVFLQHTSASLTLNENADPDVPVDLDQALKTLAPEDFQSALVPSIYHRDRCSGFYFRHSNR